MVGLVDVVAEVVVVLAELAGIVAVDLEAVVVVWIELVTADCGVADVLPELVASVVVDCEAELLTETLLVVAGEVFVGEAVVAVVLVVAVTPAIQLLFTSRVCVVSRHTQPAPTAA